MKTNSQYNPQPIDTSDITLPKDIENLVELIARNVHQEWASYRLSQGRK